MICRLLVFVPAGVYLKPVASSPLPFYFNVSSASITSADYRQSGFCKITKDYYISSTWTVCRHRQCAWCLNLKDFLTSRKFRDGKFAKTIELLAAFKIISDTLNLPVGHFFQQPSIPGLRSGSTHVEPPASCNRRGELRWDILEKAWGK